jgi:hypothetical protein
MPVNPYRSRLLKNFYLDSFPIVDTSLNSPDYFNIVVFPEEVGGGKNLITLLGNSQGLATGYSIDAEIIDADGQPIYYEFSPLTDRFGNRYLSFDIYDNTAPGLATIYLVGATNNAPINQRGYNVIWSRDFIVTPYKRNDSDLVFDKPAIVEVDQVVLPYSYKSSSLAASPTATTSVRRLSLTQANVSGLDRLEADDQGILDPSIKGIAVSASATSTTINSVDATFRSIQSDLEGGFQIGTWSKYNTIISASTPTFNSGFTGATLELDISSGTASFQAFPPPPVGFSGSLQNTLDDFQAVVVDVLDNNRILVNKKLSINGTTVGAGGRRVSTIHTYGSAGGFTGSFVYRPNSTFFITSSNTSTSFLQFTFRDLRPIGGQVSSIKTYYKLSDSSTDFKLLSDQQVKPVEFLADPKFPNQTGYGLDISDYRLIGHFTAQSIVDTYWLFGTDTPTDTVEFTTGSATYTNPQMDSLQLNTTTASFDLLYTRDFQTYIKGQTYTISFQTTTDPNIELEVYMSSEATKPTVVSKQNAPNAFFDGVQLDKLRTGEGYSRFGQFLGKVKNTGTSAKYHGRVGFDFIPEEDGLGRPVFRLTTNKQPGAAYISKVSITPTVLAGFTPNLVQYALPIEADILTQVTSQSIDLKFTYNDYTGQQSEYETFIPKVRLNFQSTLVGSGCTAEQLSWTFGFPFYAQAVSGSPDPSQLFHIANYLGYGWPAPSQSVYGSANIVNFTQMFPDPGIPLSRSFWPLPFYSPAPGDSGTTQRVGYARGIGVYSTAVELGTGRSSHWNTRVPVLLSDYTTTPQITTFTSTLTDATQGDVAQGKITSSWIWTDPFHFRFTYTGSTNNDYVKAFLNHGYRGSDSSSITNIRFPDKGLIGITRADVSNSYASHSRNLGTGAANIRNKTEALKKRRLMWPVNGPYSSSYFTENGGLYNVKFTIARSASYSPETGSSLGVYIFNANATLVTGSAELKAGYTGQIPPIQNIVRIGHLYNDSGSVSPAISWFNEYENTYYDRYDVNLVQYGTPAQLVFDPFFSGSAAFGCFITDVSFCKLGVVTDPEYIKPFNFREI